MGTECIRPCRLSIRTQTQGPGPGPVELCKSPLSWALQACNTGIPAAQGLPIMASYGALILLILYCRSPAILESPDTASCSAFPIPIYRSYSRDTGHYLDIHSSSSRLCLCKRLDKGFLGGSSFIGLASLTCIGGKLIFLVHVDIFLTTSP